MSRTIVEIGPADQGRKMSLGEFEHAEGKEGHLYELGREVIAVVDVPDKKHLAMVHAARRQFYAYDAVHPGRIFNIASGGECKILVSATESERHPDVAIYKAPPPEDEQDYWATWIPEIAIEVVSPGSEQRDYVEKREEYLKFGVREYWIVDEEKRQMLVLRRSASHWSERIVRPGQPYRTRLLPELDFDVKPVFDAVAWT